jgi:hypothetical protein
MPRRLFSGSDKVYSMCGNMAEFLQPGTPFYLIIACPDVAPPSSLALPSLNLFPYLVLPLSSLTSPLNPHPFPFPSLSLPFPFPSLPFPSLPLTYFYYSLPCPAYFLRPLITWGMLETFTSNEPQSRLHVIPGFCV